jgi:hypothetical protein
MRSSAVRAVLATVATAGLIGAVASGAASAKVHRSSIPAAALKMCAQVHVPCTGHEVHVGKERMYRLDAPLLRTANGRVVARRTAQTDIALTTGCNPSNGGYCTIRNTGVGTCWSDLGGSSNGTQIVLYACDPNSQNQAWHVSIDGGGNWTFQPLNAPTKCLNDPNGSQANGVQQQLWDCYNTPYEHYKENDWSPSALGFSVDGAYNTCLSSYGSGYNGAALLTYTCNAGGNQQWTSPEWAG